AFTSACRMPSSRALNAASTLPGGALLSASPPAALCVFVCVGGLVDFVTTFGVAVGFGAAERVRVPDVLAFCWLVFCANTSAGVPSPRDRITKSLFNISQLLKTIATQAR